MVDRDREGALDSLVYECLEAADPLAELRARTEGDPELFERGRRILERVRSDELDLVTPAAGLEQVEVEGYAIVEVIGEGGMGVVYLADQIEPVKRRVALKVIRFGVRGREARQRFELEKQALARMSHANVAAVFDAGITRDGQPYFAMEHVPGKSVTEYGDARRLTLADRLELFLQVCAGVQHAHQRGVIHRDLKPSNILVTERDGEALVKIIDFGLARTTEREADGGSLLTREGVIVGTPVYMSPEQAASRLDAIDIRTDVYSLGVLLYELLVGDLPFSAERLRDTPLFEVQRIICEEDPKRPSERAAEAGDGREGVLAARQLTRSGLLRSVRGDLDWIVMKALEKEPDRRYGTVNDLAADVRRHLQGETVSAGRPSAVYRVRKYVRRNRLGVSAAAAVALTLVAATGVSTNLFLEARESEREALESAAAERIAKDDALAQKRQADEAREAAETQREEARRGRALAEQRGLELKGLVETVAGDIGKLIDTLPGAIEAKVALTRLAIPHFEELVRQFPDDLALRRTLGMTYLRLGGTLGSPYHASAGDTEGALGPLRRAQEVAEELMQLGPDDPNNAYLLRQACVILGDVLRERGEVRESADCYETALATTTDPSLRGEASIQDRSGWCDLRMRLLEMAVSEGRLEEAREMGEQGLADLEVLIVEAPSALPVYVQLASFHRNCSRIADLQDRRDDFHAHTEAGMAVATDLLDRSPGHRIARALLANFHRDLGADALRHGEPEPALDYWAEACVRFEELLELDPSDVRVQMELSEAYRLQGNTLLEIDERDAAMESYGRALELARDLFERKAGGWPVSSQLIDAHVRLAAGRRLLADFEGALEALGEAEGVAVARGASPFAFVDWMTEYKITGQRARVLLEWAAATDAGDARRAERLDGAVRARARAAELLLLLRESPAPTGAYEGLASSLESDGERHGELLRSAGSEPPEGRDG